MWTKNFGLILISYVIFCLTIFDAYAFFLLIKQINDRYEFPLQLDLDRDNGKYLSPDADRSVRNLYTLHRYAFSLICIWSIIFSGFSVPKILFCFLFSFSLYFNWLPKSKNHFIYANIF